MRGRKPAPLSLTPTERRALEDLVASTGLPNRMVAEATALCLCADGVAVAEVARACGVSADTVRRWRNRFAERGVEGIGEIAPGRGRKPEVSDRVAEQILHLTFHQQPEGATTWSSRALARRVGVSKDTVARVWRSHGVRPGATSRPVLS
ncbi:MAG: helix-turn-helix domain-containing protein [Actinomycetota bacterium]|nr:helix-turn-helix domain-containing protein [Actinomycetota bacterium]